MMDYDFLGPTSRGPLVRNILHGGARQRKTQVRPASQRRFFKIYIFLFYGRPPRCGCTCDHDVWMDKS